MPKPVVIIPSIRTIDSRNIAAIPDDIDIIVVDDSDGSIKPTRPKMQVFTYADQREVMGCNYDLIPHKTAACRNFAFYYVYKYTDHDLIITIDDDCMLPADFMSSYAQVGMSGEWPNATVQGWYNTIALLGVTGQNGRTLYPRGFPFWLRQPADEAHAVVHGRLVCLMGLWSNVLDYDAIDKYLFEDYRQLQPEVAPMAQIMTIGTPAVPTKFSFCAMNFAFHRDMLPAAYQMPMDREIARGYPIWRFDDIWAGYVIQSLVHKRGGVDVIGAGKPIVKHLKEGNLLREIHGEHFGNLMSPYFYALIDTGIAAIAPGSYAAMYFDLFHYLVNEFTALTDDLHIPSLYSAYFLDTFQRLLRWAALFAEPQRQETPSYYRDLLEATAD
jgi:Reversibly glycosylated polypeptide